METTNESRGLQNNPFYILDIDCSAGRRQIISAAEDRSFLLDPDLCTQAQNALMNPAKRLSAELDWFPDADAASVAQIRASLDQGRPIPERSVGGLSSLNIALHNFSLEDSKDRNRVVEGIKRLDKRYTDLNIGKVTEAINQSRRKGGVGIVEQRDVEQGLQQKRYQIRQLLSQKLGGFSELACMSLMTMLANKYIGSKDYTDGVVLSDAVTEYEMKVQASLDRYAEAVEVAVAACRRASQKAVMEAQARTIEDNLRNWAGLATPMNIRAQASGMPYQKAETLIHSVRELAVWLQNEKNMTDLSIKLVDLLRRMFSGNTRLLEKLDEDEAALNKVKEAEGIKEDLERMKTLLEGVKTWPSGMVEENAAELQLLVRRQNKFLKEMSPGDPRLLEIREMVCLIARAIAVEMHNSLKRTDLACEVCDMLLEEFRDIPKLKSQLEQEKKTLDQQLVMWHLLEAQGRGTNSVNRSGSSTTSKETRARQGKEALARSDYNTAYERFKQAADMGSADAMNQLGLLYHRGQGVQKDYYKAMEWYRKAADKGFGAAMNNIGNAYLNGWGVQRDPNQGAQWLQKASDAGFAEASNALGKLYYDGKQVKKDLSKATSLFRKAANAGDASGMWNYACMLESGLGVQKDQAEARTWFAKAADRGHKQAPAKAADMFERTIGGKKDLAQVRKYRTMCAQNGDRKASLQVASMYAKGEGGSVDMDRAIEFQEKAMLQGLATADDFNTLGEYYQKRGSDSDLSTAREKYSRAIAMGSGKASQNLQALEDMLKQRRDKQRKKKKNKFIAVLIILAAVAALIFGQRFSGQKKGLDAFESGDYATAAERLKPFKDKYAEEYQESCYQMALVCVEQEDIISAHTWIMESGKIDTKPAHYIVGMRSLLEALDNTADYATSLETAEQELKAAAEYGDAKQYLSFVRHLRKGNFSLALEQARKIDPELSGTLTVDRLLRIGSAMQAESNEDKKLQDIYLRALRDELKNGRDITNFNDMKMLVDSCYSGMDKPSGSGYLNVASEKAILEHCEGGSGTKILILRSYRTYRSSSTNYDIYLDAMEKLPMEYIPYSLSEVGYILVIGYDYQDSPTGDYGWYGVGSSTDGIQETGAVKLIDAKTGRILYSASVIGPDSPQSFSYSGTPPAYKSGGAPNLAQKINEALTYIS